MKNNKIYFLTLVAMVALALVSCKKEKTVETPPPPANEEELITTFRITFSDPSGTNPDVTAVFQDIDGPGGNDPVLFDTIRLKANSTYHAAIEFLNESVSPAQDLTEEILEESTDHLICFTPSGINVSVARTDSDGTYEIGLESTWTTQATSEGSMQITLKHQPGIKNGSCDIGESDIELNFHTIIE